MNDRTSSSTTRQMRAAESTLIVSSRSRLHHFHYTLCAISSLYLNVCLPISDLPQVSIVWRRASHATRMRSHLDAPILLRCVPYWMGTSINVIASGFVPSSWFRQNSLRPNSLRSSSCSLGIPFTSNMPVLPNVFYALFYG